MVFNEDICLTATTDIPENADISVDLNGKTITVTKTDNKSLTVFNNYGKLTMLDSVGTGLMTARIVVDNYKTLVMNSGTLVACDQGGACVYNNPDCNATFTMNNGTLKATYVGSPDDQGGGACIRNMSGGKVDIIKGVLDSVSARTYAIITNGQLNITPKTKEDFSLTAYRGIAIDSGDAVINNGTFTILDARKLGAVESYYAVYTWQGKNIIINGGTFTAPQQSLWSKPDDGWTPELGTNNITINGGTFTAPLHGSDDFHKSTGNIKITGGTFYQLPSDDYLEYCFPEKVIENDQTIYKMIPYIVSTGSEPLSKRKLGEKYYMNKNDLNEIFKHLNKLIDYRISLNK